IRDVSCPLLIRATRVKILFQQIFRHRKAMFSVAGRQYLCVCFVITPVTAHVLPVGRTVNPQRQLRKRHAHGAAD
ncbi:TPA: hypothetical protein ACPVEL_000561, partial [Escherichia coli]